jgi:Family of unknown function (DUF6132)
VILITAHSIAFSDLCAMKNFLFQNKLIILGIVLGAVAGFMYWKLVGCNSGSCAITSKWHNSTGYGALMGGLFLSIFKKENQSKSESDNK